MLDGEINVEQAEQDQSFIYGIFIVSMITLNIGLHLSVSMQ